MNTSTISSRTILYILSVVLVPVLLLLLPMRGIAAPLVLTADFSAKMNDLEMFWNGSGVNRQTADYKSKAMRQNMLLIGLDPSLIKGVSIRGLMIY